MATRKRRAARKTTKRAAPKAQSRRRRTLKAPVAAKRSRAARRPTAKRATRPARTLRAAVRDLRFGAIGDDVLRLQKRLAERGFPPGRIDGEFGAGTEAAVLAFQLSQGLLVDGVAGRRTQAALGLIDDARLVSCLDNVSVQLVSRMCPGAPLGNIKKYLPPLLAALQEAGLVDKPMALMAIATIRAESGGFAPIDEYRSRYNTSPAAESPWFDLYDNRNDIGNQGPPDGSRFKGRGFVQLTGRTNYTRYSRQLGLGDRLVREPELANDSVIAARILASFLKDRELKIKGALLEGNLALARRYVNGGRHGLEVFSEAYTTGSALLA
jgi:peptidoglycan L-alanyl-D-glutamate endopeptidase CwlK